MLTLYSNEIVFRGHPDKVCDQISDALLTAHLREDKNSRCGIEVVGGKRMIFITGEVTSKAYVNIQEITKAVLSDIGYNPDEYQIVIDISRQSPDIAQGVDIGGAGDQGMMFGYACNDTYEYLPTAMMILQDFAQYYDGLTTAFPKVFYPDGKAQITGYYNDDGKLESIKTFTISYQNSEENREWSDDLLKKYACNICAEYDIEIEEFLINPTGKFLIGGFKGDAGLTGRKIVVDNYQSFANVGGGAFSGKDPTKVDRSGAYKARQIAIRYLKELDLKWCSVQLSYAIGRDEPLAIYIDSDIGQLEPKKYLYKECTPKNIIDEFGLRECDFYKTAQYGHFTGHFPWEQV